MRPAILRQARALLALCLGAGSAAALDVTGLRLESLATDLERVAAVTHAGGERLFIVQQGGEVLILEGGEILPQPFLDISDRVRRTDAFDGLLALAFHPRYAENGFVYANFVDLAGNSRTVRYRTADPDHVDPASERTLLVVEEVSVGIHHVGPLRFGPDGYLYVGSGDSGPWDPLCAAQDDLSLEGKLLRLDADQNADAPPYYGIPADNPFAGLGSAREEIWAKGLRNPWSFSFDRETGDLFIADVGQGTREEVNFEPAGDAGGRNYGWKSLEGTLCVFHDLGCGGSLPPCDAAELTPPILEYDHRDGRCAIIGGYVYRGRQIPGLYGAYLYGDWCTGTLWAGERAGVSWRAEELPLELLRVTTFGEGPEGEVYLATHERLFRLAGPQLPAAGLLELAATELRAGESDGGFVLRVRRLGIGTGPISVEYATHGVTASPGSDYREVAGSLAWTDGDVADQDIVVPILDDALPEPEETLTLALGSPAGGAVLGARSTARLTVVDDEPPCVEDATHLCLNQGRFRVDVGWVTGAGAAGAGQAVRLTPSSGYFWFFGPGNPEIFVKVLNACVEPFDHFWFFAAGLTDVRTRLTVLDTASGEVRVYDKPSGVAFQPIRDTRAFATCGE